MNTNASRLRIWDNAAFEPPDMNTSKENYSPPAALFNAPSIFKKRSTTTVIQPLQESLKNGTARSRDDGEEVAIQAEIEAVEAEIVRLSARLEELKIKKVEMADRIAGCVGLRQRGRIVPSKFMENLKTPPVKKKIESPTIESSRRRGLSMGSFEISRSRTDLMRRVNRNEGLEESDRDQKDSIAKPRDLNERIGGPSAAESKSRKKMRKLEEVNKKKTRRSSTSHDPQLPSDPIRKRGQTFIVNPKKLEGSAPTSTIKKNIAARKLTFRSVASRYSLAGNHTDGGDDAGGNKRRRKWSMPEQIGKEDRSDGRRKNDATSIEKSPSTIGRIAAALPKIKTVRCSFIEGSPRDSGRAKRVAEMVGTKRPFAASPARSFPPLQHEEEEEE